MTDAEKIVLWTMGALAEITKLGLIYGPPRITGKGLALWDQLDASGFRPSNEGIDMVLASEVADAEARGQIADLVRDFRDNRADMLQWCEESQ